MNTAKKHFAVEVLAVALMVSLIPVTAAAQHRGEHVETGHAEMGHAERSHEGMGQTGAHMAAPRIEKFNGPHGYDRIQRPAKVDKRPATLDRDRYNHNYKADRGFRIGPYHPPGASWQYRRWQHGDFLPAEFWGASYLLSDYWLFGLDIPPVGYEWVRYGNDALLINLADGEIVQTVYDDFL